jgi:hypothetical protein
MSTASRVASSPSKYEPDTDAINAALNRLYGAAVSQVHEIVSELRESDRAVIAVFCNGRAHMHAIGLAIAAQCTVDQLTAAAGSRVAGTRLFDQARELPLAVRTSNCARRPITLAKIARTGFTPRVVAGDD